MYYNVRLLLLDWRYARAAVSDDIWNRFFSGVKPTFIRWNFFYILELLSLSEIHSLISFMCSAY